MSDLLRTQLPILGIPVTIESDQPAVMAAVEESFGSWRALTDAPLIDSGPPVLVRILTRRPAEPGYRRAPLDYERLTPGDLRIVGPGVWGEASVSQRRAEAVVDPALVADRGHFRYGVLEALVFFILTQLDRCPLHAAAVARGDAVLLLAGPTGVGKSSLSYAAGRAGFRVLSDDTVYLQAAPQPRAWFMPGWIHLPADAAHRFPELTGARLQVTGAGEPKLVWQVPEPGPAAVRPVGFERVGVCVLDRGAGSEGLERIGTGELEAALDQSLDGGFRLLEALVRPQLRRLAASGGWRLRLPADPEAAMPLLDACFDGRGSGGEAGMRPSR